MLNLGKGLCAIVLPAPTSITNPLLDPHLFAFDASSDIDSISYPPYTHQGSPFVTTTYDREMWVHLCSDFSPQIVRVYGTGSLADNEGRQEIRLRQMYYAIDPADDQMNPRPDNPANYPAGAPLWNHKKQTKMGLDRDNLYPACVDPYRITSAKIASLGMPVCPEEWRKSAKPLWRTVDPEHFPTTDDPSAFAVNVQSWKLRGGIAAGMAVFSYLEQRVAEPAMTKLPPYYDQCEQLP